MKILLLGGSGAIGTPLALKLSALGVDVYVSSRSKNTRLNKIHFIKGNAKDKQFLKSVMSTYWNAIVDFMNYTLEDIKKQSPYPIGELNTAYAKYFVGNSYLYSINNQEVNISNVTFEPGCRNNWHIHHGAGQILLCTAGRGYYQEWGKPAQELNVGDTVYIAPEIKHWHGAAPESYFVHIAESVPNENASNEWLEAVDKEEYLKLK